MVGSDGTVVIVDGYPSPADVRKIYWIDRSGTALAELVPPGSSVFPRWSSGRSSAHTRKPSRFTRNRTSCSGPEDTWNGGSRD